MVLNIFFYFGEAKHKLSIVRLDNLWALRKEPTDIFAKRSFESVIVGYILSLESYVTAPFGRFFATYRKGNILDKNKTNITNEKIYRIELTNEEYEYLENLKKEFCNKLSKMSNEEITEYLKSFYPEQNLNFEKEIKGTVYKVNTYFNKDSEHTILTRFFEIFQK